MKVLVTLILLAGFSAADLSFGEIYRIIKNEVEKDVGVVKDGVQTGTNFVVDQTKLGYEKVSVPIVENVEYAVKEVKKGTQESIDAVSKGVKTAADFVVDQSNYLVDQTKLGYEKISVPIVENVEYAAKEVKKGTQNSIDAVSKGMKTAGDFVVDQSNYAYKGTKQIFKDSVKTLENFATNIEEPVDTAMGQDEADCQIVNLPDSGVKILKRSVQNDTIFGNEKESVKTVHPADSQSALVNEEPIKVQPYPYVIRQLQSTGKSKTVIKPSKRENKEGNEIRKELPPFHTVIGQVQISVQALDSDSKNLLDAFRDDLEQSIYSIKESQPMKTVIGQLQVDIAISNETKGKLNPVKHHVERNVRSAVNSRRSRVTTTGHLQTVVHGSENRSKEEMRNGVDERDSSLNEHLNRPMETVFELQIEKAGMQVADSNSTNDEAIINRSFQFEVTSAADRRNQKLVKNAQFFTSLFPKTSDDNLKEL